MRLNLEVLIMQKLLLMKLRLMFFLKDPAPTPNDKGFMDINSPEILPDLS